MAKHIKRTFEVYQIKAFNITIDENDVPMKEDLCELEVFDFSMDDTKARAEVREALGVPRLAATVIVKWEKLREVSLSMTVAKFIEQAEVVQKIEQPELAATETVSE